MEDTDTFTQSKIGHRAKDRQLLGLLAVMCGLLIISGAALPILTGESASPAAIALGDVSEAHIVEIRDRRGETVLSGEFRSRVDMLGNTEKDAALTDRRGRTVVGEVELEIPAPDARIGAPSWRWTSWVCRPARPSQSSSTIESSARFRPTIEEVWTWSFRKGRFHLVHRNNSHATLLVGRRTSTHPMLIASPTARLSSIHPWTGTLRSSSAMRRCHEG